MLADDDQDDEEDAGDGDCDEKDDEGRHLHQIEGNEETNPSKSEEDIAISTYLQGAPKKCLVAF